MRAVRLNHTVHLWAFKSNNELKEATNDFFHFRLFTFLPAREEVAAFPLQLPLMTHSHHQLLLHVKDFFSAGLWGDWTLRSRTYIL